MWGTQGKQEHYSAGRAVREVRLSDIEGVCACGYLSLKPTSDFEDHNGGLTVKRSKVTITRADGSEVKRITSKKINRYGSCNACVNDWR